MAEVVAPSVLLEEWIALRLWHFLEAPADLGARAVCALWGSASRLSSSAGGASRLRLPHLGLVQGAPGVDLLRWAQRHVSLGFLESFRLPDSEAKLPDDNLDSEVAAESLTKALCWFAREGDATWVEWLLMSVAAWPGGLLERRASMRSPSASQVKVNFVVLQAAASAGHAEVVQALLRAAADVSASDENECTALHWAADKGHPEACRALLEGKAQVNVLDDDSWTPLCLAAEEGHVQVCKVLLEARAGVNLPDEDSRSPLWWAAWKRHDHLVTLLLSSRADLDQSDHNGVTPSGLLMARSDSSRFP
ncbi:unnamed protein product [Polarella glacialis]|uniref:Uncharacterized protein n=2 Tax=Polarella glacialis TaxID=89957 RepID=A0A813GV74_POLGL|nr:unnamed protein product [Polarella glacialis]CAE8642644.1 unnamed protein product [Polarella glacialis]